MRDSGRAGRRSCFGTMLQKKAPNDLKSLDAELKSAHALRGAAGRARCSGLWSFIALLQERKVPWPSVPKASQRAGARRRIRVGRRAARRRVGAAKLGPADRRTIGGAYRRRAECPVRRQRAKRIGCATRRKLFLAARP